MSHELLSLPYDAKLAMTVRGLKMLHSIGKLKPCPVYGFDFDKLKNDWLKANEPEEEINRILMITCSTLYFAGLNIYD